MASAQKNTPSVISTPGQYERAPGINPVCGSQGVDDEGHCVRCSLFPSGSEQDGDAEDCPPGFLTPLAPVVPKADRYFRADGPGFVAYADESGASALRSAFPKIPLVLVTQNEYRQHFVRAALKASR